MEWRKLKNIILLILLAVNLALAPLVLGPQLTDYYHQTRADREAEAFLQQRGIDLQGVELPDPGDLPPLLAERDRTGESAAARALLGEDVRETARGGGVYRYESERGTVQFHSDGSFMVRLSAEQFPLGSDAQTAALNVLEKLNFFGQVTQQGESYLTVCQTLDGAQLFNQQATVVWSDTGVIGVEAGRRIYGEPEENSALDTITRATALIDFYNGLSRMGDVCSRVDEVIPGYISTLTLNHIVSLTPVWRVTTDTGAYQLDLVSGELTRVA